MHPEHILADLPNIVENQVTSKVSQKINCTYRKLNSRPLAYDYIMPEKQTLYQLDQVGLYISKPQVIYIGYLPTTNI